MNPSGNELVQAFDSRPLRHTHNFGVMILFLRMVLASIRFRAVASSLKIFRPLLPRDGSPCANGGQFWLLRLGLYELIRPKEQANDWVWLLDHTIQTGNGKCLLVLGVRLSLWQSKRLEATLQNDADASFALTHHDLSVWEIERVDSSSGETVCEQLRELSRETGVVPSCLLTDQGADLKRGCELFCQDHPETASVHDIAHAAANALKRQLNGDEQWQAFLVCANQSKTAIRQTPLAFLMPPDIKAKARWMNLEPLIGWSRRVLRFLENPQEVAEQAGVSIDLEPLQRKLGWLGEYAEAIARWSRMLEASAICLKYIRNHGYHSQAPQELQKELQGFQEKSESESVRLVIEELKGFVKDQSMQVGKRRVPGSSEVLESLIGKGKQLMGRTKNGYTKMVLGMAASVVQLSVSTLQAALSAVKVRDVNDWVAEKVGTSLQSLRQRLLLNPFCGTKTG